MKQDKTRELTRQNKARQETVGWIYVLKRSPRVAVAFVVGIYETRQDKPRQDKIGQGKGRQCKKI